MIFYYFLTLQRFGSFLSTKETIIANLLSLKKYIIGLSTLIKPY